MVVRGGALLRPVQDCRRGYGKALGIARVTRLDAGGFEQEVETIIEAGGPLWPGAASTRSPVREASSSSTARPKPGAACHGRGARH